MGNRCHVIFPQAKIAVYLHWNGGLESVLAFLDYMNERKLGCDDYGAARFCQVVGNFFGGNLSLGVRGMASASRHDLRAMAYEDNGAFVVERSPDGLRIAEWWRRDAENPVLAHDLADYIERARVHPYNLKGELLATIRQRNEAAVAEAA